jgi:hypothetical protein
MPGHPKDFAESLICYGDTLDYFLSLPVCSAERMSALGQKQTYALQNAMSALPPIATATADIPRLFGSRARPEPSTSFY